MKLLILFLLNLFFLASGQRLHGKVATAEPIQKFPFVVKILKKDCAGSDCACAGALIGGSWVLAPAKCVRKNGKDLKVTLVAGDVYAAKYGKVPRAEVRPHLTISYPGYDEDEVNRDIALLFITKDFIPGSDSINLPLDESLKSGDECTVVGFENEEGNNDEAVLMQSNLKVVSRTGKTVEFKAVRDNQTFPLPESFSGLLVCRNSNGMRMRTLFGFLDGAEVGGVRKRYVRVNPFKKWIREIQKETEMEFRPNMIEPFALYSMSLSAFVVVAIRYFAARRN